MKNIVFIFLNHLRSANSVSVIILNKLIICYLPKNKTLYEYAFQSRKEKNILVLSVIVSIIFKLYKLN